MNLNTKKNIIFVSISSDLYGSSKLLLTLVLNLKKASKVYHPIVCMPNEEGLLKDKLISEGIEIMEMPVLKLKRSMLKSFKFSSFFKDYKQAKTILHKKLNGRKIHCIHSNTLATMFGSIYCFRRKTYHIIHVHEIMDNPWFIKYLFSFVQFFFADKVIFNSNATEKFYTSTLPTLKKKSVMIYNGVDRHQEPLNKNEALKLRQSLFKSNENTTLIGLIGRFNRLKGHKLLIEAFEIIQLSHPNTKLCFIGSPPEGQEHFLEDIIEFIKSKNISSKIDILPFQENIFSIIDVMDIVVVPSIEPESFGIIAVESMLSHTVVVASNIGGLADVIDHNETGLLFEPQSKKALSGAILKVLNDENLKRRIESKAYQKAQDVFSSESMTNKFISTYSTISQ